VALESYSALDIINTILLDGMKVVGELFGSGQMQLPFVLESAEVMKSAVRFLEPHMEKVGGASSKGTMVLATVKGDVHDIGKNLVDIILTNNGYKVINLGIKQPIENILSAFEEHSADAIGMSGLLVKSTLIMKENLEIMNERGLNTPVVLGGAALTRRYVEEDLKSIYKGKLFYARDAFDGLHVMDALSGTTGNGHKTDGLEAGSAQEAAEDIEDLIGEEAKLQIRKRPKPVYLGDTTDTTRSDVKVDVRIPEPPFFGSRVVKDIPLQEVFDFVNQTALFKGQWQYKQGKRSAEEYKKIVDEKVMPVYEELKSRCIKEALLVPQVVYGYYACQSEGNDLIIYEDDQKTERLRFTFPRQRIGRRLCLSDFFAPKESGRVDTVAFHLVTVGRRATEYSQELFAKDNYADYLYFHGLSVEAAEALAELWHKRIREELGIAQKDAKILTKLFHQGYQGSRYSFGYPACPNLEDQSKLFELIDPSRIGVELTEEFQLDPEQSTSAIIVHHEEAKYFSIE
jgi:5-methyltetrahydrofolate--homocysteine methyltransferase